MNLTTSTSKLKFLCHIVIAVMPFSLVHAQHEMHSAEKTESHETTHPMGHAGCDEMHRWDYSTGMCAPVAMKGMPMSMLMIHGNAFLVGVTQEKPRGANKLASTNMIMSDIGSTFGDRNYLNLNLMLTAEKWTLPKRGYPELLQVGEHDADGNPYIDAQHPHSSPLMGLTVSDTITLDFDQGLFLKVFFAPRGQTTDGPTAFMHRPTGMVNPDAPLGHHIGQDVGHISSTVLGTSLRWNKSILELSAFHGEEPEPTEVDLPLGSPNSYSARIIHEFSDQLSAMVSGAYVKDPEPDDPTIDYVTRYSGSVYWNQKLSADWNFQNALIYGLVNKYDHASSLNSFGEEFVFSGHRPRIWGRIEVLERTPAELGIASTDPNNGKWVSAFTLGYTHRLITYKGVELSIGGSGTKNFLPNEFRGAYGGDPWSGKVFYNWLAWECGI